MLFLYWVLYFSLDWFYPLVIPLVYYHLYYSSLVKTLHIGIWDLSKGSLKPSTLFLRLLSLHFSISLSNFHRRFQGPATLGNCPGSGPNSFAQHVSVFASISDEQFQCYPCTLITSEEANGEWLLWDALSAISLFILFLKISAFWPIRTRKFWFFFFCILVGWIYGSVMFILNCVIYPNLPKGIEDNHILLRSIDVLIGFMFFFFNKPHYFNVMW